MNTIAAIETHYKGYRFRSRLEARWAMFYDLAGIGWSYEADPISVDGEAYLPDFILHLPGEDVLHEVKSLHEADRIRAPAVYLGGKMDPKLEWRGAATRRSEDLSLFFTEEKKIGGAVINMTGPVNLGPHRGGDEWARHNGEDDITGGLTAEELIGRCFRAIDHSDIFCAHINSNDAYGTLVEVGYARARGLQVSISVEKALTYSDGGSFGPAFAGHVGMDPETMGHGCGYHAHDLWFAQGVAHEGKIVNGPSEAQAFHGEFIRARMTREYRLISGIGAVRPAVMTFGDPVDIINRRRAHTWGAGSYAPIQACTNNRPAAERVRAHRFDGR